MEAAADLPYTCGSTRRWPIGSAPTCTLRESLSCERRFLKMSTDKTIRCGRRTCVLDRPLAAIEEAIAQTVEQQPAVTPLATVNGVGSVARAMLACLVPEPGRFSGKAAANRVGVATLNHGGGAVRGARGVYGGHARVRAALWVTAQDATRHAPAFHDSGVRLKARDEPSKVATAAVVRKLIVGRNARMRDTAQAGYVLLLDRVMQDGRAARLGVDREFPLP